ncbi:PREDICTED: uncharacterized protein LOC109359212 isoform X2 [Lupinus angustifolius]|uniref:uncharacterized protein LOC109359212 isoform X2 n=1 Tax=Lupinus angustifolius TaxID=3871 RepID=UPI00092F4CD7|nr:PREDICTED: uncharacterized protein LOC109359212 isoform X2 [Lupinus angustifolius]
MVGVKRRSTIAVLAFLMLMGIAVYFRLWVIDYKMSSDESELLRRQFDIANREAMDESAEWRLKYDQEAGKAKKCLQELKLESSQKVQNASDITGKLAILKKENAILLEMVQRLQQELEEQKSKCNSQHIN